MGIDSNELDQAERSAALKLLLEMIEADRLGMLAANWDDAAGGAENTDLREALLQAIALGRIDIVELFIEKLGVEMVMTLVPEAIPLAISKGNAKMLKMLIRRGWLKRSSRKNAKELADSKAFGMLPMALRNPLVQITLGQNVAAVFFNGMAITFLISQAGAARAIFSGWSDSDGAAQGAEIPLMSGRDLVDFCERHAKSVDFGALQPSRCMAVDCRDLSLADVGCYPLHEAVMGGELGTVRELIDMGCDVNLADRQGNTPLHLASERADAKAVDLLLGAGADPTRVNQQGNHSLDISTREGCQGVQGALGHAAVGREMALEAGRRGVEAKQMGLPKAWERGR